MTKSELFKKAHKNTKEMKKEYKEINYRFQFGIELKELYKTKKEKLSKHEIIELLRKQGLNAKLWEKYGKCRIYVDGFHYSKSFYIDIIEKKVVANRPGAVSTTKGLLNGIINYPVSDR
jgi:hypothetical protein